MDLEIDGEKICLLTNKDKEMLGKYVDRFEYDDLVQKVYTIAVLAFMDGMKYMKEKDYE